MQRIELWFPSMSAKARIGNPLARTYTGLVVKHFESNNIPYIRGTAFVMNTPLGKGDPGLSHPNVDVLTAFVPDEWITGKRIQKLIEAACKLEMEQGREPLTVPIEVNPFYYINGEKIDLAVELSEPATDKKFTDKLYNSSVTNFFR